MKDFRFLNADSMEDISVLIKNKAEWMKIEKSLCENVYDEGICVDARDISVRFKREKLKKSRRLEVIYRISGKLNRMHFYPGYATFLLWALEIFLERQ